MVYVDDKDLGYSPYYERWMHAKKKQYNDSIGEAFADLY
jgi:hypothetical protein